MKQLLPGFLAEQAFDLNLITLYAMQVLGAAHAKLEATVREKSPKELVKNNFPDCLSCSILATE
jgi:hypothetical protein